MFVDEENMPMVHQDEENCDYYRTPDMNRVEHKTSFATEPTSALRVRQKLTRDKIVSLYRYLSVTGDPGLADWDQFIIKKNSKTGNIELLFLEADKHRQSLTNKRTGEFLAAKTLREKIGGLNIMKTVLSLDEIPSALERSVKTAINSKVNCRKTCRWRVYH